MKLAVLGPGSSLDSAWPSIGDVLVCRRAILFVMRNHLIGVLPTDDRERATPKEIHE